MNGVEIVVSIMGVIKCLRKKGLHGSVIIALRKVVNEPATCDGLREAYEDLIEENRVLEEKLKEADCEH